MNKINIHQKLQLFSDQWSPKIIGSLNGQDVKLAKIEGEFVWHSHKDEDELFYVLKGTLIMEFRDKTVELQEGEMIIVFKGVEHRPIAKEEVHIMLFEPSNIKHTGEVKHEITVEKYDRI